MIGTIITAGAQLAGNIYGMFQKRKAQNKYESYLQNSNLRRQNDLDATFNKRLNQDFFDTAQAKQAQTRFQKYAQRASETMAGQGIAGGATPEAMVASNESVSNAYGEMLGGLSAQADAQKKSIEDQQFAAQTALDNQVDQQQAGLLAGQVQSADNLVKNINESAGTMYNAIGAGAFAPEQTAKTFASPVATGGDFSVPSLADTYRNVLRNGKKG